MLLIKLARLQPLVLADAYRGAASRISLHERFNYIEYVLDVMSNDINERFEYMEDFLCVMSNDINNIGEAISLKAEETSRGKTAKTKKMKKKMKQNLFSQAKSVEDEENGGLGRDRLLQVSLSKQVEAKIDSQNGKIDKLEAKMDKFEASQDKLEVKIDALSGLMARLLDATQQKQE